MVKKPMPTPIVQAIGGIHASLSVPWLVGYPKVINYERVSMRAISSRSASSFVRSRFNSLTLINEVKNATVLYCYTL